MAIKPSIINRNNWQKLEVSQSIDPQELQLVIYVSRPAGTIPTR